MSSSFHLWWHHSVTGRIPRIAILMKVSRLILSCHFRFILRGKHRGRSLLFFGEFNLILFDLEHLLPRKVTMLSIFQSLRYVELNDRLQLPLINVKLHKHILRILVDRVQLLKLLRGLTPRPLMQSFPYQHYIFFGLSLLQECSERKHILFSLKLSWLATSWVRVWGYARTVSR